MSNELLESRIGRVEQDLRDAKHAHTGIYERLSVLERDFASTSATIATIFTDLGEIKASLNVLKDKPGKRWESVTAQIITIVVAALFGLLLAKFI
ncbi:MAG: hypothetical protein LBN97_04935 [Oscillospiraceae bacterium]|jgi:uncharacterized protein YoxC|nr:hypothetical protein [Oscillospiraceae bacterium]